MSELADVSGGQSITSAFTNQVKERTVMRYTSAGARDASITVPQEGSLAYLLDENVITYYDGTAWVTLNVVGDTEITTLVDADTRIFASVQSGVVTLAVQTGAVVGGIWTVPPEYRPSVGSVRWTSPAYTSGFGGLAETGTLKLQSDGGILVDAVDAALTSSDLLISTVTYVQGVRGI